MEVRCGERNKSQAGFLDIKYWMILSRFFVVLKACPHYKLVTTYIELRLTAKQLKLH